MQADPINFVALVSLALMLLIMPAYIRWLKSKQIEQYIREEGPKSHAAKAKTPTMGGLCFMLVSATAAAGYLAIFHPAARRCALFVVVIGVLCGLVGFVDDFAKLTSRSNKGLSAALRLAVEFGLGLVLSALLFFLCRQDFFLVAFGFTVPITGWGAALYFIVLVPFLIAATTNAINLHDGMDGLAAGTSSLVFAVLFLVLSALGQANLACICAAMVGALAGFLFFNKYPARVFMGDTGSLFIGGVMASVVAASGLVIWFVPLAIIYIAETLSVICQVVYFKLTKPYVPEKPMSTPALVILKLTKRLPGEGKRLLRMAPLHHHFEAIASEKGQPEWKTVAAFLGAQALLCTLTYLIWRHAFTR